MHKQHSLSEYTLKPKEAEKIIQSAVSFRDRCILKCLYYMGLRREEVTILEIKDLDFERKRVNVYGKGNKLRTVPVINPELLSDLKYLIGTRKTGPVFVTYKMERLALNTVNLLVSTAGKRAGIENPNPGLNNINPHIFRHSIARHLKDKGFSAEWVQNFLGHASYKTTMDMYGTLSLDEMQAEASKRLLLE